MSNVGHFFHHTRFTVKKVRPAQFLALLHAMPDWLAWNLVISRYWSYRVVRRHDRIKTHNSQQCSSSCWANADMQTDETIKTDSRNIALQQQKSFWKLANNSFCKQTFLYDILTVARKTHPTKPCACINVPAPRTSHNKLTFFSKYCRTKFPETSCS